MTRTYALRINGTDATVDYDDGAPLLFVLRDALGLTGTHYGCGTESCGACRVEIDGAPAYACTLPAEAAEGRDIRTIEGVAEDDPVLRAFEAEQAGQCAYCLPGVIMTARMFLRDRPDPLREEVAAALEPHLCRCGVHRRIVSAVLRAAETLREDAA